MSSNTRISESIKEVLNQAPCGIGVYDIDTSAPVFLNTAYYNLVGYTPEEHKKYEANSEGLMFPEDIKVSHQTITDYEESGAASDYEYRIVRKDGKVKWIKLNVSTIMLEGKSYAFTSFMDVTKEHEASAQISLISDNIGSSMSIIKIVKEKEELVYANELFFRNIGVDREQYQKGMPLYHRTFVTDEDHDRIRDIVVESLTSGKPKEITHRFIKPDGTILWFRRHFAAIKQDEPDTYLLISVVTDVTDIKEHEFEIELEQRRFQTVVSELNAAVFEWDLKHNQFYASESYGHYAMSKISTEDILNNTGPLDTVHPEDIEQLKNFFAETKAGKSRVEVVLRLRMTAGGYRWCRMIGLYYKDADGNPDRTIGVIIDVNEEHERSVMLGGILNLMPGGIGIWRFAERLECQYYSDGFAKMAGITREEMDARIADNTVLTSLIAAQDLPRVGAALAELTSQGKPIEMTYRYYYSDGSIRWLQLAGLKLRDEDGYPVYYCMFTNPTNEAALYRSIVEDSTTGVIVMECESRNTLYINDEAREYLFVHRDAKLDGHSLCAYLNQHGITPLLNPEQFQAITKESYSEFHIKRGERYCAVRGKVIAWNGVDSYVLYITDETTIYQHNQRLQELIDQVPGGIGIYEIKDGKVSLNYLNDAYYRMLGDNRDNRNKYVGDHAMDAACPEDRPGMLEKVKRLISGSDREDILHRVKNSAGEWVWLNLAASVVERRENYLKVYASFTDCDEMIRSKEAIEQQQKKEQYLLNSIPGGIAIYRLKKDGRVSTDYISECLATMCGYEREEFLDILRDNALVNIAPSDIPIVMDSVNESVREGKPISVVYHIRRKNSTDILIRLDASAMEESELGEDDVSVWYAVHTIVSENSQMALREQSHYRTVLEMLGIAYWEWSAKDGFYTSENYSKYALSKKPLEEMRVNRVVDGIVHPDDVPLLLDFFSKGDNGKIQSAATLRMQMSDGSYRWTELLGFEEFAPSGKPIRMSCTMRDVNDEWLEQKRAMQNALDEAQKANAAKTAFLSRVSHDMRTPLNGILGLAGLMKENITNQKVLRDLMQMETSGKYLLNLINDTLDVGRIESGKLELHPSVCDGHAIFDSVISLAKPTIDAKHIHVDIQTSGLQYPMLYIDIGRVEQIMLNILGNAAKFTPENGHITCAMKNLSVIDGVITDEVCISDDGIGISREFLPHIFEPFSQEDSSKKNSNQGTGLGMIITKQLVEMMGGTIRVESEQGNGTRVTFTLIMPIATQGQIDDWKEAQRLKSNDQALSGKRILLCEDHPLNAQIVRRLLEKKGIIIDHAENGQVGLNLYRNSPVGHYDAIIMDIRMPVMDGLETTVAIRALEREDAASIPIIAMTANALDEDVRQTREAGMSAHLSKPVQPELLYRVLSDFLSKNGKETDKRSRKQK